MSVIDKLGTITSWIAAVVLLFVALLALLPSATRVPLAGILYLLLGIFALPPVRQELSERSSVTFSRGIVAVVLIIGSIAGFLAIGFAYDGDGANGASNPVPSSPAPENDVRCWFDDHSGEIGNAEDQFLSGMEAYEAGEYSRSLMHLEKAFNRYESLNQSAHGASISDSELQRLVEGLFYWSYQASAAAYSMVYEIQVNDDYAAGERHLELLESHAQKADGTRDELKTQLGLDQLTDLTALEGDCGVF